MDPSTYRGLTFLLSLGSLPLGCTITDGGTSGNSAGTNGTTGGGSDTTGGGSATDTPTTTDAGTGGQTSGTGDASTGGAPTTGASDDPCAAYVAFLVMCDATLAGMEADLLAECQQVRMVTGMVKGDACLALHDAYLDCIATAACDGADACQAAGDAAFECTPPPGDACKAYAAKYVECNPGEDEAALAGDCQAYVNYGLAFGGPACGMAYEERYACLGALSCGDLGSGTGCEAQEMSIEQNCG